MNIIKRNNVCDIQPIDLEIKLSNYDETINLIPKNIIKLSLVENVNTINNLPTSITKLSLSTLSTIYSLDNLPYSTKQLLIYVNIFKHIDNIPHSLIYLRISNDDFNIKINNLPNTILYLYFRSIAFNKKINKLPKSLISLEIYFNKFNNNIGNIPKLEYLRLNSNNFNKPINNLSICLSKLMLSDCLNFNQSMDNLPKNLKKINQDYLKSFNKNLHNLPSSLVTLELRDCINLNCSLNNLPLLLKYIEIYNYTSSNKLHHLLKKLKLDYCSNNDNIVNYKFDKLNHYLVESLTNLKILSLLSFSDNKNMYLENLPNSFTILILNNESFNKPIDNLPCLLTRLMIRETDNFNQLLNNLPNSLVELYLNSECFNKPLLKLPHNIYLIYNCQNELITNISHLACYSNIELNNLPNTIRYLELSFYDKPIDLLPESIQILKLFCYSKQVNDLPSSIKEIWIYKNYEKYINPIYKNKIKYIFF